MGAGSAGCISRLCQSLFWPVAHSGELQAQHTPVPWVKVEFRIGLRQNDRDPHHLSFIHFEMAVTYFLSGRYKGQIHIKKKLKQTPIRKVGRNVAVHCPIRCILRFSKSLRCFNQDLEILFKYILGKNRENGLVLNVECCTLFLRGIFTSLRAEPWERERILCLSLFGGPASQRENSCSGGCRAAAEPPPSRN